MSAEEFLKSAKSNMYPITSSKTNMSVMNSKQFFFCSFPFTGTIDFRACVTLFTYDAHTYLFDDQKD